MEHADRLQIHVNLDAFPSYPALPRLWILSPVLTRHLIYRFSILAM